MALPLYWYISYMYIDTYICMHAVVRKHCVNIHTYYIEQVKNLRCSECIFINACWLEQCWSFCFIMAMHMHFSLCCAHCYLRKKNAIVYISVLHLSQSSCEIITLCTYICMYISRYVCTLCLQISVLFLIHGSVPDVIFNACFKCVRCVQSGPTAQMCL